MIMIIIVNLAGGGRARGENRPSPDSTGSSQATLSHPNGRGFFVGWRLVSRACAALRPGL